MGDKIYVRYLCPCRKLYVLRHSIEIDGIPTLKGGTVWEDTYQNTSNGAHYLVEPESTAHFFPLLGDGDNAIVVNGQGLIDQDGAVTRFRGMKSGRKYKLRDPKDRNALAQIGYSMDAKSWMLLYVGPDRYDKKILRFSIAEYGGDADQEAKDQVEYIHSLHDGPELVVRGVRIRVDNVENDGTITYTVINEGSGDY